MAGRGRQPLSCRRLAAHPAFSAGTTTAISALHFGARDFTACGSLHFSALKFGGHFYPHHRAPSPSGASRQRLGSRIRCASWHSCASTISEMLLAYSPFLSAIPLGGMYFLRNRLDAGDALATLRMHLLYYPCCGRGGFFAAASGSAYCRAVRAHAYNSLRCLVAFYLLGACCRARGACLGLRRLLATGAVLTSATERRAEGRTEGGLTLAGRAAP